MKEAGFVLLLVLGSFLLVFSPVLGVGLEEVIVNVTLSGGVAAGVEGSFELDDNSRFRAGLSLLVGADFTPVLWGRAVYVYNINPQDRLSYYGGGGLSAMVALTAAGPSPMALLEAPLGVRYAATEGFSLLGEVRLGFPWLNPLFGREISTFVLPIGLTAGVAFPFGSS